MNLKAVSLQNGQEDNTEPLWTVEEVAQYLRLEPDTVRAMARDAKLPAIKVGRMWRFRRSALHKYFSESTDEE